MIYQALLTYNHRPPPNIHLGNNSIQHGNSIPQSNFNHITLVCVYNTFRIPKISNTSLFRDAYITQVYEIFGLQYGCISTNTRTPPVLLVQHILQSVNQYVCQGELSNSKIDVTGVRFYSVFYPIWVKFSKFQFCNFDQNWYNQAYLIKFHTLNF